MRVEASVAFAPISVPPVCVSVCGAVKVTPSAIFNLEVPENIGIVASAPISSVPPLAVIAPAVPA